jgi:hypothetical protein
MRVREAEHAKLPAAGYLRHTGNRVAVSSQL